jgi:hypothetical protein
LAENRRSLNPEIRPVRIAYFRFLLLLIFLLPPWFTAAQAEGLRDFSPQGAVKQALRATAIFTTDMVALGASDADAPFAVTCAVEGHGRWLDSKTWQYTLKRRLVNTEHCSFKPRAGLKTLAGEVVEWTQPQYEFFVAGPWLAEIQRKTSILLCSHHWQLIAKACNNMLGAKRKVWASVCPSLC